MKNKNKSDLMCSSDWKSKEQIYMTYLNNIY